MTTSAPVARSDLRSARPTIAVPPEEREDVVAVPPLVLRACRPRSGGRSRARGARTADPRGGCRTGRAALPPSARRGRAPCRRGRARARRRRRPATRSRTPSATRASTAGADARGAAPQTPVLDDAASRSGAARRAPPSTQRAQPLRLGRRGRVEHLAAGARAPAGRRGAGIPVGRRSTSSPWFQSRSSIALGGLPVPHLALSRSLRRSVASRAAPRARISAEDSLAQVRVRARRPRRTTAGRRPASRGGRAASPRPGAGTPRAPSTRTGGPARSRRGHRFRAGRRRPASRARCGGCARPSRSSRAGRTRGVGPSPRPPPSSLDASGTRSPAPRSPDAGWW